VARLTVLGTPRFEPPAAYAQVVAQAFSQRRKTLRNSLRQMLDADAWAQCGVDPAARPEVIAPEGFARLAALARPDGL
jgi:16S rRNA (adenine1518-N6/adenine1519-N6)-dimethyltransferase